ncbi:thiol-disulfide oxidoreductase DCC family protein [Ornithinibacillus halophilus]|uniref:Predicted thiol-disulfide oxidoreductase YuxK, DCC family n=1 Tax=Ornithinibacillus halophilus TaxID=930117 RepID=A0A1M5KQE3_9BACI|nr:thiol-disulfide oxidoreductase DCC family protein [Ornithinibacillus halophilus]SHG55007.1 Predicted thiol-disulfide oxidoreductase YuxK, DCC family [Ornithinibacillus halophilus]
MDRIILFDGVCNFCNSSVQFIIKRDPKGLYKYASLQSDIGQELLKSHQIPNDLNSFIFIEDGNVYFKSTAALRVCWNLKGFWKFAYMFIVVPKPIRDVVYNIIAKNRYRWFGKREQCMIPSQDIRNRFL